MFLGTAALASPIRGASQLEVEVLRRDITRRLCMTEEAVTVSLFSHDRYLVKFSKAEQRIAAMQSSCFLSQGRKLRLSTWNREINAVPVALMYRVRLCIEGVPLHGRQVETVACLFKSRTFVEEDKEMAVGDAAACFRIWVWTFDPNSIPKAGTLELDEPLPFPDDFCPEIDQYIEAPVRHGRSNTLKYLVIIHIDLVVDYSPIPDSSSDSSIESETSGIPASEPEIVWPVKYPFYWHLGIVDGQSRVSPSLPTTSRPTQLRPPATMSCPHFAEFYQMPPLPRSSSASAVSAIALSTTKLNKVVGGS
ncbi:hypothetical protein U9M48_030638 [Paspalum notatum var. saurae]|uniref:Uncharacterized protein n=1 Tax=Paspalum notatum var. saurae TaxID=547442 RepID=A0AAQ3X3G9_PASNO